MDPHRDTPLRGLEKPTRDSFRHATDGIVYAFRTQRHLAHYFVAITVALVAAAVLRISPIELLFVFSAIMFVLVAEMVNTSLEAIVDIVSPEYSPLARAAKDSAAAAVLVACCYAVSVMLVVFFGSQRVREVLSASFLTREVGLVELGLISFVILVLVIIVFKERAGRGTLLHGGAVSGHASLSFLLATFLWFASEDKAWSLVGFVLAALVAQSRVEGRIHSVREVVYGAMTGVGLAAAIYAIGAGVRAAL